MAGDGELFMDNLEEFVYDEDRIVTYKWLSRTLTVTANQAKQMLYAFLTAQQEKKNKPQLSVTYLVGGRILQHGEMCSQYVLTTDDRLEETKSQFDPVTSVHIYSIQKQTLKDSNSLYMVDYDISREHKHEDNRWSHIYCKEAARLGDGGESRAAAGRSALGKENSHPGLKTANGHSKCLSNILICVLICIEAGSSTTDVQKNKAPPQKSKKGQLPTMGMFAVKTEKKPEPKAEPVKPPETKKQDKSNSGGMLSFFGKPTAGQSKKTEAKQEKIEKKSQEQKPKKEKIHEKESATSNEKKEQEKERKKSEGKPKPRSEKEKQPTRKRVKKFESSDEEEDEQPIKSKSEKKSRKKSNDNKHEPAGEKTKQKRKRAKNVLSDESTDDESPQASEQSVISETPVAEQQTKPRVSESAKRRKRQKVLHSKTYMNDEGFMVTEKVYESESTDASDEEPVEVKPAEPKKTSPQANKKALDPKSAKQSSLMSFFGKK
ncbi:predicted protein [Nematostella vectensis]|uniref:DNA polymerase delta subunit 3 n=1 Tax=Nematostella vectensis TaxID=45351 RepID=A7SVP8_NEMVE|nr:predicted protein [Nematostella vectensis]|eukprot:XP_001624310.1 predicted protein [Nematostella vectensis]